LNLENQQRDWQLKLKLAEQKGLPSNILVSVGNCLPSNILVSIGNCLPSNIPVSIYQ